MVRLTSISEGVRCRIASLDANGDGHRLREIGLIEGREIALLSAADPVICAVDRNRFALARRLVDGILVAPPADHAAR